MARKLPAAALALTLLLTACRALPESSSPPPDPTPTAPLPTAAAPSASPAPADGPLDPLTGLLMAQGNPTDRPIAVMLNNLKGALPQLGNAQADIIYEVLAEGGITRMLAVYQNVEAVGLIGSVRSARPYYLELALGHDAIFLHAGGSPDAYSKIKTWKVDALDCVNGPYEGSLYWRDQWRRKNLGFAHSVVTSGEVITSTLPQLSLRLQHEEEYTYEMSFTETPPSEGEPATTVTVPFSTYKTGLFQYDADAGAYLVSEYDKPYIDGNDDSQVAVTNLLILKAPCTIIPGDSEGRLKVDLSGGEGWYAREGLYVPIRWDKEYPDGQLRYYTDAGQDLPLLAGNSYVCIIPTNGSDPTFE